MFAAAKAAVVPGRATETVAGFASTVATFKLGTKSCCCFAVAMISCFSEWFSHPPSVRPPASNKNPPSVNRRPPRRRRTCLRCLGCLTISRRNGGLSCRFRSIVSFLFRRNRSFIGEILEHAIGCDAIIALAQHGKQIRDDQQGRRSGKQQPADHRARQRGILLFARAANR